MTITTMWVKSLWVCLAFTCIVVASTRVVYCANLIGHGCRYMENFLGFGGTVNFIQNSSKSMHECSYI